VSRPKLCNQLSEYAPRTRAICDELQKALNEGRKLLILSDRREHLAAFDREFTARGFTSIGYYVGGMKAEARDESATKQIVLGTFTLAAEGMNIRDLNTVALVTPKSRIEQAVGRIFRLKKEERVFQPLIFDVIDAPHDVCVRQYRKRRDFYRQCAYKIRMIRGALDVAEGPADEEEGSGAAAAAAPLPAGVPMFRSAPAPKPKS
jgi:superfamily II DNA or RNA helicase